MTNQEITTELFDFEKICRTCLKIGEMNSLYDKIKYSEEDLTIALLLKDFGVMQISEYDCLPQQICIKCTKEINKCYFFIKKCQLSDEILREYIKKNIQDVKQISTKDKQINSDIEISTEDKQINSDVDIKSEEDLPCIERTDVKTNHENSFNSLDTKENSEEIKLEPIDMEFVFLDSENATEHNNESIPSYECERCSIVFKTQGELLQHKKTSKHRKFNYERRFPCEICLKPVRWSYMKNHKRSHTKEKPHKCKFCPASFSLPSNLSRHIGLHTDKRPYKCNVCQRGFAQLVALKSHVYTHTGEKPHVCTYCGKSFRQTSTLRTHIYMHTEKKEGNFDVKLTKNMYPCNICEKKCATLGLLNAHRRIHEKKFLCSNCGKSFATLVQLQSHLTVHTGERPFHCDICGKSFGHITTIRAHRLMHTGEKPFQCKVCSRPFALRNHLKTHMRTHSGERPYSCSICKKTFAVNGNLKVHMRIHTGETPFSCPTCGKGFYETSSMKKHIKKCK